MALIDDFKARFPEFDPAIVDQRLPILEGVADCYFCGDYENSKCDREITLNLLAHLLVIDQTKGTSSGAAGGGVASKSVGNVSVSYHSAYDQSSLRDFFGGSKYGMMFLQLTAHRRWAHFV